MIFMYMYTVYMYVYIYRSKYTAEYTVNIIYYIVFLINVYSADGFAFVRNPKPQKESVSCSTLAKYTCDVLAS